MNPTSPRRALRARRLRTLAGVLGAGRLGAILLGLALSTLALPAPAHAASRPYAVTENAVALPPGGMRLEAGLSRERWDNDVRVYALTAEFSYSLYANLDLEVEVPWAVAGRSGAFDDGLGDIRTRAKINFVKERVAIPLTLSGLVEVKFPTGFSLISSEEADVRLAGLATKAFGPITVHGNLFYTFVGGDQAGRSLRDVPGLSVGVEGQTPLDGTTALGEFIWERARVPGTDPRLEVMGGARHAVTSYMSADFTVRLGFGSGNQPSEGAPDYTVAAGLTWDLAPL